jgi:hypothetical protein
MIPIARRVPKSISAPMASQTSRRSALPWNAGLTTSSNARPSVVVSAIDETANSSDPATDIANGPGCRRTYVTTNAMPRRNNPRPAAGAAGGVSTDGGDWATVLMNPL